MIRATLETLTIASTLALPFILYFLENVIMRYQILIRHQNGTRSYMTYRNRTSWGLRCAKGHLDEFISNLAAGYFPHIVNAELEIVK